MNNKIINETTDKTSDETTDKTSDETTDKTSDEAGDKSIKESKDQYTCTICMKEDLNKDEIYYTNCGHEFCKPCLDDWFERGNQSCPLCRSEIKYYKHNDEKYKLIIHKVENDERGQERVNQLHHINLNDLINRNLAVRNIVKANIRLRFYGFSMTFLLFYMINNYLYELQNINDLNNELKICNINNTHLQDSLNTCESNNHYLSIGYYVSMFNGELSRRCFYPLKFYNICFNK